MKEKRFRWWFAYIVSRIYLRIVFGNELIYENDKAIDRSKPLIILGNHSCFYDFVFAVKAIGPYPVRFVVAAKYFVNPFLGTVLNFFGAIPKKLAEQDFNCLKTIKACVKDGHSVAIYPEGRVSMWGITEDISYSTAKLVKGLDCNVVLVQNKGGFFLQPPYGGSKKRGKTQTKVKVLTKEEIDSMSVNEFYDVIMEQLNVNQYNWYEEKEPKLYGSEKLGGLTHLLYRCPDCMSLASLHTVNNKLTCSCCGLKGITHNGHIEWEKPHLPSTVAELYKVYKNYEQNCVQDEKWFMETDCNIEIVDLTTGDIEKTVGCLTLNTEGIQIKTEDDEMTFTSKSIDYLPFDVGRNVQIYHKDKYIVIMPTVPALVTALAVCHEVIRGN